MFDFHCHPSFKTFLGNRQASLRKNCWTTLNFDLDFKILDSQSSLSQVQKGKGQLIVAVLYGLESAFAGSGLIKLAAGLSPHVEKRFLQEIEWGEWGYNQLMMGDWQHLMDSKNIGPNKTFKPLKSIADYDPQTDQIQVILAAEGGHNFYDSDQLPGHPQGVLENLRFHKQPGSPRLLYVTLTHLQQSAFCTHAYGMKLIKNPAFNPTGRGLRPLGKSFIDEALTTQNGKRILIDVKHMSWQSRKEFYRYRDKEFPEVPIVATHMGVTGVSVLKKPVKKVKTRISDHCVQVSYYRVVGAIDTYFNPWSINLYDEDIEAIMQSGGLIGLSLDQRILGFGNVSKENFSMDEFLEKEFEYSKKPRYHPYVDYTKLPKKAFRDLQLRYFCNNWLHVVKVGIKKIGADAWNHICIGSDFDGLIDPLDDFKSAAHYSSLFARLVEVMPVVAQAMDLQVPPTEVQDKVRGLIFDNALSFLKEHYQ